ncbi:MAG: site-specific integrase [Brevefilum sp.]|nr:site-specific integrase [Brevefilum sp.]MDT8382168.1 site-specific integrase [Brevefilum sp.]MDW7754931.1 site-specific integrase [Brevefilum sp.]
MTNQTTEKGTPAHLTENALLQPAIQAWRFYLNDQGRSPHTVKAFIADLNLLDDFLPPDQTLGEISLKDLENFTDWLENDRGIPCSPKSLSRRITSLKSFFRWLQNSAVLLVDPADKLVQRSVTSPLPDILSPEEIEKALATAREIRYAEQPDARPYTLIKLLLETAVKKGECQSIALKHLSLEEPEKAFVFIRYTNPRYRYKERKIPLTKDWVESFNEYVNQYEPEERLFPWTPRRLEYILEDITEAAGLEKRISFDMCRWTSVLQDLIEGVEPDKIRQKLGVSKIQFREIRQKLRKLAMQQGFNLAEEPGEA